MKENATHRPFQNMSLVEGKTLSRREFLGKLAIGGGALVLLAGCGVSVPTATDSATGKRIHVFIAVDYSKCTGCRTCEAVCAAYNHPQFKAGGFRSDVGNPLLANIRVHSFNPDVSAPVTCARCDDTPCVEACPVDPDPATGHRAIYQEPKLGVITNDPKRCIACGGCVEACADASVGILAQNPETDRPIRMCTLCDGHPQCVEQCPYEAISILRVNADYSYYRMAPEDIANKLNKRWYDLSA